MHYSLIAVPRLTTMGDSQEASGQACRRNNIPIDVTPGIQVSLIVQPGDTRYLAPGDSRSVWYDLKTRTLKRIAQPYFWWKMRPKKIGTSETLKPPAVILRDE